MDKVFASGLKDLPVAQRLQLVEEIWNSIAEAPEGLGLSEAEKRLLDERIETIPSAPSVP